MIVPTIDVGMVFINVQVVKSNGHVYMGFITLSRLKKSFPLSFWVWKFGLM